ncbi:MAG TPA: hypothetical protein VIN93_09735, partial [Bryobacteraceae bacterium]
MIRHHHEGMQIVVPQLFGAVPDGSNHELGDGLLLEKQRPAAGSIEVSVHPDKGLPGIQFVRRRVEVVRETAVKVPGDKQGLAFRVDVGKATLLDLHEQLVASAGKNLLRRKAETNLGSAGLTARATSPDAW